jgi:molybdopterin-guanine dinucleotide biosynthesis protein
MKSLPSLKSFFLITTLVILEGFKEWKDIPKIWLKRNDEEGLPEGIENIQMVAEAKDKEKILSFVEEYLGSPK